jgi:hypothetical protein
MEEQKNKKTLIFTLITIIVVVVGVIGASYAYFQATIGSAATTYLNVRSNTVDVLTPTNGGGYNNYRTSIMNTSTFWTTSHNVTTFKGSTGVNGSVGTLYLIANQANFASGSGDLCSYTSPYITLTAKNSGSSTYNYQVNGNISTNGFVYTVNSSTKELVLTVVEEVYNSAYSNAIRDGQVVPASKTVLYNKVDITARTGAWYVPVSANTDPLYTTSAVNHSITANAGATKTVVYRTEVCFVNLGTNQYQNGGKSFLSTLQIKKV